MTQLQEQELNAFLEDVSKMLHYESAYYESKKRTRDGCRQDKERWYKYRRKVVEYMKKLSKEKVQQPMF